MAMGSTQPLREMSTRNLPTGKGRPAHKADNPTAIWESNVYKMWEPRRLTTLCALTACYRDNFTFFFLLSFTILSLDAELQTAQLNESRTKINKNNRRTNKIVSNMFILLVTYVQWCIAFVFSLI
jgi:hypothetical protein